MSEAYPEELVSLKLHIDFIEQASARQMELVHEKFDLHRKLIGWRTLAIAGVPLTFAAGVFVGILLREWFACLP